MIEISVGLVISAFIAGLLMFLAPCTLPLVPAYLAFISGVKQDELTGDSRRSAIHHIRVNAVAFVLGFSIIFILFGLLAGLFGSFIGQFRGVLTQVGGAFIILFAFMMLGALKFAPLMAEHKIQLPKSIKPGNPFSAALIGAVFALGWTPCVGPVLASVLLLASTSSTALSGAFLLGIFSLGMGLPFIAVALLYARAEKTIAKYAWISQGISIVGGVFLLFIGILLVTDSFGLTVEYGYRVFNFFGFEGFFDHF